MHFVYIIYSPSANSYYVGESVNTELRLVQHNEHEFKGAATAKANDWLIKLVFTFNNRSDALKIEGYIKSMKSRKFIIKLIEQQDFRDEFIFRIKEKFSIELLK